jgi:translocation and assembly module TamA
VLRSAVVVLSALTLACTPARREVRGDILRTIRFEGNGGPLSGQNDYQLAGAMAQRESPFGVATWPFIYTADPVALDRDLLPDDARRIEVWYAHNGWFNAKFLGWQLTRQRAVQARRAGMVELVGHVAPGELSTFRRVELEGLESRALKVFGDVAVRTGYVFADDAFNLESVDLTAESLRATLTHHGYPWARVTPRMEAYPDEHVVDVTFVAEPGTRSVFGPIEVTGVEHVDEAVVRDALAFEPGEVWDGRLLQKSQQRLFALGTFSLVDVSPSRDVEPGEQREVPVTVAITESRFQTVRAGVGANYDGILLEPRLSTSYRHVHLLDRLLQAELTGQIGYSIGSGNLGPERGSRTTGSLALSMSTPRLAGPHTGLAVSAALSRDIFGGQYLKLDQTADARFTWRPDPDVTVDVGPGVERTRIGDGGQRLLREVFGRDFDGTYVLAAFGAGLTIDWRDDPLATTRGSWFQVGVRQTLPLGTRPYVFSELSGDARTFRRIRLRKDGTPFTFAGRLTGRTLVPWGGTTVPYPERAFLGGSANLRSFRVQQVGAYDTVCTYRGADPFTNVPGAGEDLTRRYLPQGGTVSVLASGEARVDWAYGVSFAPFVDAGLLAPDLGSVGLDDVRFGVGVGARYKSLVGPIRLDVSLRPLYPEDGGPNSVSGCRAADAIPRAFDLLGVSLNQRYLDKRGFPLALNVMIAIGEAF